jgi:protoheme IX farnesyltransferase
MSSTTLTARRALLSDYVELTKPRITLMVVLTTLVGFVMGSRGGLAVAPLAAAILGTALVASGASALNMVLERRTDALMRRTRSRPLPSGRLRAQEALAFGLLLTSAGLLELSFGCGPLAAAVGFASWASYVFVYTPLKAVTSLSTLVGAVPGALPPVIGWVAARGSLDAGAVVLFAILFLWQVPHFLAIAWLYRDDYAEGGLPMLPVLDPSGRLTFRQAVAHCFALLLVSLTPTAAGMAGSVYLAGAAILGLGFAAVALRAAVLRTTPAARALFLSSVLYLPALYVLLLVDRV